MAPRFVYLGYPVDQVASPDGTIVKLYDRLEQCKDDLLSQGVDLVFDPGDAFRMVRSAEVGPEVRDINQLALDYADAALFMLPAGLPTIGVPMEIDAAVKAGKAVAVVTDVKAWMLGFPDGNVQLFGLSDEGFTQAVIWVAAHPRVERGEEPKEKLPFVVTHKTECGRTVPHDEHNFGEEFEGECDGIVDLTPRKTYLSDAGFDLVVAEDKWIGPGQAVDVPMGIAVQLPSWSFGRITGRSSTLRRRGLLVVEGIIDESYRGDLFALTQNLSSDEGVSVRAGERIAQLVLHSNVSASVELSQVQDLVMTARGSKGFGSSGT